MTPPAQTAQRGKLGDLSKCGFGGGRKILSDLGFVVGQMADVADEIALYVLPDDDAFHAARFLVLRAVSRSLSAR
jgi:hypothetical protein